MNSTANFSDFKTIFTPPTQNELLTQDQSKEPKELLIVAIQDPELCDPEIIEINSKRLAQLQPTTETVMCYFNQSGQPIVELRKTPDNTSLKIAKSIRDRAVRETSTAVRFSDAEHFELISGYLEQYGVVLSAVTANNPYGLYVSEGLSEEQTLIGHELNNVQPTGFQATHLAEHFSPQKPESPKTGEVGLNYIHSNNMAVSLFENGVWSPTYLIPSSRLSMIISNNSGLKYAQSGFEGAQATIADNTELLNSPGDMTLDCQVNEQGEIIFFRLDENAERLRHTAEKLGMPPVEINQFIEAVIATAKLNANYIPRENGQLYFSICLFGTTGGAGASKAKKYLFTVEAFPYGSYQSGNSGRISLKLSNNSRSAATGDAKAAANYGPWFNEKAAAKESGYTDIICLDKDGNIEEVSSSAPIFIKMTNGQAELHAPIYSQDETDPTKQRNALNSITRKSVIEIAQRLGIKVIIRDIHHTELPKFTGLVTTGTAAGLTKVGKIGMLDGTTHTYTEESDEVANLLYTHLMNLRKGISTDPRLNDLVDEWTIRTTIG